MSSVANLMIRWGLALDGPPMRGWMSTVWPVRTQDGRLLALKVLDDPDQRSGEGTALKAWAGDPETASRVVQLHVDDGRSLLLERLDSSRDLQGHPVAAQADEVIGDLIGRLTHCPAPLGVPSALAEARRIATGIRERAASGSVPGAQIERALSSLAAVPDGDRLLHWDLHYLNVLRDLDDTRWVAIDPLPHAGVPEWEVIAVLRNRWADVAADPDLLLRERLRRLCAPGSLDQELAAALAQAVAVDNLLYLRETEPEHLHLPPYQVMAAW